MIGVLSLLSLSRADKAHAALVGVTPGFPRIAYGSQGVMTYDAATDAFAVNSVPAAIRFAPASPPRMVVASAAVPPMAVAIQIRVGANGALIGGQPGDDLRVTGAVDADGNGSIDYTGILLTGEILAFGFEDSGISTDFFDFIFSPTGGALAPLLGNDNIGATLIAENSTFTGTFAVSFASTKTKGDIGPVEPICGDGIKTANEQCDDGNNVNGDGCSATCRLEVCGNGVVDAGEQCDNGAANSNTVPNACRLNCTLPRCGDGVTDSGESCDDGNANNNDGCRTNCTIPRCGDGILDTGEQCDNGAANSNTVPNACRLTCTLPRCGDGVVDSGEVCDDGNTNNNDGCRNTCRPAFCGDGILDAGEQCDNGANNSNTVPNACRLNCTNSRCGDGVVDTGETCDDGNTNNTDGCRNNCSVPRCGDGILDIGEQCDNGAANSNTVPNACRLTCTLPRCGDGVVDSGETCDDGNTNNFDACRNSCVPPRCGDRILDQGEQCDEGANNNDTLPNECRTNCLVPRCGDGVIDQGEFCDDGNFNNLDNCRNNCTLPFCGDGILDIGEQCDNGTANSNTIPNACRTNCALPRCGDGVVDNGETCDDGNTNNTDGCRNNCTLVSCGDGVVDAGEECDDGNTNNDDGCRNDCTRPVRELPVCGDGVVDPGEVCDDGNANNFDACRNNCLPPFCGDGILDPGEQCDNGTANSNIVPNACRLTCTLPRCGDGVVDTGEVCDDGNTNNLDLCRNTCVPPRCGDGILDTGEQCDNGANNSNTVPNACRLTCTLPRCGDGVRDAGEACDDGNANNSDGCRNNCTLPSCGDGVLDAGEQCDNGVNNSNTVPNACRLNCTLPRCGDGVRDNGELCDDGNLVNGDGCQNNCTPTLGGCCIDGDCVVISREDCAQREGEFLGLNTNCDTSRCGKSGACCIKEEFCEELTEEECDEEEGEFFGPGTTCNPAPATIAEPGRYRLLHTQDTGVMHPPSYGLRLDGLFGDYPTVYTFNFVLPGTKMFLDYDGTTICIHGRAYGGKDVGNSWAATKQSFVDVHMVYGGVVLQGNQLVVPLGAPTAGSIKWLATGQVIPLSGKDNGTIIFGFSLTSGEGWLMYESGHPGCCLDFKFNDIDPIPSCPGTTGACCLESGLCFTISRECCAGIGGEYQGDDTVCEDVECGPAPKCGDGHVDPGEQCDDGDQDNLDGCRNNCMLPRCGDHIRDANEQCDDGNTYNNDGCSSTCQKEDDCVCGPNNKPPTIMCPPDSPCACTPLLIDFETNGNQSLAKGFKFDGAFPALGVTVDTDNFVQGHPDLAIIFDSANPTGGDTDLATPGSHATNTVALGKVLIIAENATDSNNNGRVDDPDDEAARPAGWVKFTFTSEFVAGEIGILDAESGEEAGTIYFYLNGNQVGTRPIPMLGDASHQGISFAGSAFDEVKVKLGGSGAITFLRLTPDCDCDSGEPDIKDDCDDDPVVTYWDEEVEDPEHLTTGEAGTGAPIYQWRVDRSIVRTSTDSIGAHGSNSRGSKLAEDVERPSQPAATTTDDRSIVRVPHESGMELGDGAIALRFRFDDSVRGAGLFSKDAASYGTGHLRISTTADGRVQARLQSETESYLAETAPFIQPNEWYGAVFTFGSGGMRLYVNGESAATNSYTGGLRGNYEPIALGGSTSESPAGTSDPITGRFQGELGEVRMYDHALTDDEIEILHKEEEDEDECPPHIHRTWRATDSCGKKAECTQILFDPECEPDGHGPETATILFVVPDPGNLGDADRARKELMESWDFNVVLIDVDSSQAAFNTAAANADAAYITEKISSANLGTKLSNSGIGVVSEEGFVHDALWMTSSDSGGYTGRRIDVVDKNHYITEVFDLGSLTILSADQELVQAAGTMAGGCRVLGEKRETNIAALFIAEQGATLMGGHTAAGRRVMLPWAKENFDFSKLTTNGKTLMRRSLEWAASMD